MLLLFHLPSIQRRNTKILRPSIVTLQAYISPTCAISFPCLLYWASFNALPAEMDNQSPPSSSAATSHQPLQYGHVIEIMPIVCDQCRPLGNNNCNRQYPYCFHCDKKGQVCSYTQKVMDACRPCRFNMGLGTLQNCDRKVPRCTMCEFEGLACYSLDTDNIEYNTKCNQCRARNHKCVARQNAEPCEFCKSERLLCTYVKARRSVPE